MRKTVLKAIEELRKEKSLKAQKVDNAYIEGAESRNLTSSCRQTAVPSNLNCLLIP